MSFSKIKKSLAFRIPLFYKFFLTNLKNQSHIVKPTNENNLVMLCGTTQFDLLKLSLESIRKNFSSLPQLFLFTDKCFLSSNIKKRLSKWYPPELINIITAAECISYHKNLRSYNLAEFAEKNPMGLKLAAILQVLSNQKPILYCDTDVIWRKDPFKGILKHFNDDPSFKLAMSEDFQAAYDKNLIQNASMLSLNEKPFYCAGIIFLKTLSDKDHKIIQRLVLTALRQSDHFTEQTIFSYINKLNGNDVLSEVVINTDDQFDFLPVKRNWTARHYVGPVRHLFWRDAFFLRLGLKI